MFLNEIMTIEYMMCFCVHFKKKSRLQLKHSDLRSCVYMCVCTHMFPVRDIKLWKTENKSHKIILLDFQLIYKHVIYW